MGNGKWEMVAFSLYGLTVEDLLSESIPQRLRVDVYRTIQTVV